MSDQDTPATPSVAPPSVSVPSMVPVPSVTPTDLATRLSDAEVQALERQNNRRQLLKSLSDKAVAEAEVAELQYKNMIMQFFMQYNLNKTDSIGQDGMIMRGNVNVNQPK